jgi:hypothetical protein
MTEGHIKLLYIETTGFDLDADEADLMGFARAIEQASRRAALEEIAARWEVRMEDADDYPSPSAKYPDLRAYHLGIAGEGEHAYNWEDKPHRLVYDLTRMIAELRDEIRSLADGDTK